MLAEAGLRGDPVCQSTRRLCHTWLVSWLALLSSITAWAYLTFRIVIPQQISSRESQSALVNARLTYAKQHFHRLDTGNDQSTTVSCGVGFLHREGVGTDA